MKKQFIFLVFFSVLIFGSAVPFIANAAESPPACTASDWSCVDWGACHADGNYFQNRTCSKITNCEGGVASPATQQICTPPFCTSYTYSDWSSCDPNLGSQERINISSSPDSCIIDFSGNNPAPITRQYCIPECTSSSWSCGIWNACSSSGSQTRTCTGTANCQGGVPSPVTTQSCAYTPPLCTYFDSWSCSDWSACSSSGSQNRTCNSNSGCQGGVSSPTTNRSCVYIPSCTSFNYSSWSQCTPDGKQTRNVTSKYPYNCEGGELKTTQSCTYTPPAPTCNADTWTCGDWNSCSLSGIQNRSCRKTFDCPNAETAPPITDQYCTPPNLEKYQISPADQQVVNQNNIIKATVNLWCLQTNEKFYSVGSGTIIDSNGTILTNKHVVEEILGCRVGFVENYKDDPYFGDKHIADIIKTSTNADIAILKLRNPSKKILTYIDITRGSSDVLSFEDKIITYGYPTAFGKKITSTRGDFSGVEGDFLKTTAIIDKGNSGGGAYLQDGTFIGMPTKVFPGTFNVLGGILSVNKIKSWLSGTSVAYNDESYNKYSRVSSVLENIDLKELGTLKLFISDTDAKGNNITPIVAPTTNQRTQEATEQPQIGQPQEESTVIESSDVNQNEEQDKSPSLENEQPKPKRFFPKLWSWFMGLFGF